MNNQSCSPDTTAACHDWPGDGRGDIWSANAAAPAAAGVAPGVTLTRGLGAGIPAGRPLALIRTRRLPAPAAAADVTAASAAHMDGKLSGIEQQGLHGRSAWTCMWSSAMRKGAGDFCAAGEAQDLLLTLPVRVLRRAPDHKATYTENSSRRWGSLGAGPLASAELATETASGDGGTAAMPVATAKAWTT